MKKVLKAVVAVLLSATLLFVAVPQVMAGVDTDLTSHAENPLRFNSDGSFRIIQFADTQDNIFLRPGTIELIKESLRKYKPDLVVFTGDNTGAVATEFGCKYALKAVLTGVEEAGVPFTCVLGNHDAENVPGESHLRNWRSFSQCLAYDADPDIYGVGNHNLTILDSKGTKVAYNLWMFDSNMYDRLNGGYDYIHEDQFDWYRTTSDALKEANGGEVVPSMCFQHIIPKEIENYMVETDTDDGTGFWNGDVYTTLDPQYAEPYSVMMEHPCPGTVHSHQLQAFEEQGDVVAVFTGHDHINDFVVRTTYQNAQGNSIHISTTPTAGFCSYGNEETRGIRIIDINENDPWNYKTWTPTFFEVLGSGDSVRMLSYFSKPGAGYWYASYVFCLVPFVGDMLRDSFLRTVWGIIKDKV